MNKKIIIITISLFTLLLGLVAFSSVYKGRAVSYSEEYQISGNTLVRYSGTDEMCVIPETVKVIGTAAFEGNTSVKRIALPKNLKEIQYNAFADMTALERIVLPDTVEKIGPSAFANCSKLDYVYLGAGLNEIGDTPFSGCNNLKSLEVSDKNNYYTCVDGVLYSADRSKIIEVMPGREKSYYVMPDKVTSIEPYAFYGCDSLMYLTLSDGISDISAYSFSNASGLKTVSISFNTTSISMKAFENCKNLEQVYIPDSVQFIHDSAFDGCDKLSIYALEGTKGKEFSENKGIELLGSPEYSLDIASEMRTKTVEENNAKKEENQEKLYDLDSDDSLGATFIVNGQAVVIMDPSALTVNEKKTEIKDESADSKGSNDLDSKKEESNKDNLDSISLGDYAIPEKLFYKDSELKTIELPEKTTSIGKFAFARSGLEKVDIPEGVKTIGYGAFYHCDNLSEVVIPDSVTEIEAKAFDNTKWLNDWYKFSTDDYLIVGDGVLLAYKGDKKDYVKPDNVKYVSCVID